MCGINGFNFVSPDLIKKMNNSLKYRGPDDEGEFIDETVSLGHRRLSIIDLSENGKQPMSNEDGKIWITFNGEIYNYGELRNELKENHVFKSDTDTEIIIHAYEEWGFECVKKFNGMWAFCIYDQEKNIFFLSRDRLGIKPMYYYFNEGKFIFSSEIKAILNHPIKKELNRRSIPSYLMYRHVIGEETFFQNIFKLLPGSNLLFDLNRDNIISIDEYWDVENMDMNLNEESASERVLEELKKSISYMRISDVPLGVILSGGLDSSIISALLAKSEKNPINTFTVKFNEQGFDETLYAKKVSDLYKTNYKEVALDTSNFINTMKEYIEFKDEPIGVPNEISLYLLSKKIKENVSVVLSGEGADEIFEGYGRIFSSTFDYEVLEEIKKLNNPEDTYKNKFSSLYQRYEGRLFDSELDHFLFKYGYWSESEMSFVVLPEYQTDLKPIFKKYFDKYKMPYSKKISYVLLKLHLPSLLQRLDSSTMASSIEGRVPFLDHHLVNLALSIPSKLKTKWLKDLEDLKNMNKNSDELCENENISKYILKKSAESILPEEIINRKKQGFPLPLEKWFKNDFMDYSRELILSPESKVRHLIDQKNISEWMVNHQERRFGQKLWMVVSLELWLRHWFPEL